MPWTVGPWQRGQTSPGNFVRSQTWDARCTWFGVAALPASPVCRSYVPVSVGATNWFTTHTGAPVVSSGSAAPEVEPFGAPPPRDPDARPPHVPAPRQRGG